MPSLLCRLVLFALSLRGVFLTILCRSFPLRCQWNFAITRVFRLFCVYLLVFANLCEALDPPVRAHSFECIRQDDPMCHSDLVQILPVSSVSPNLLVRRVGEAMNPGPEPTIIRLALTNPTSIVSKEKEYTELRREFGVHIAAAAETAATNKGQRVFRHHIRQAYPKMIWSPPVAEKRERSDGEESLRGQASGVALLSVLPIRHAQGTLPNLTVMTSRLLHGLVTVGHVQLQIFVMYGFTPGGHQQAHEYNADLLNRALDASVNLSMPTIILGDFNGDPFGWSTGARLRTMGFHDLPLLHQQLHQKPYPPTCKDATTPDNGLFCPRAAAMVSRVEVLQLPMFDAHQPVLVDLSIATDSGFERRLPMPKSFLALPIDLTCLPESYNKATEHLGTPNTLEEWGIKLEYAVDQAYRLSQLQHDPQTQVQGLPKSFRGRCQPRSPKTVALRALLKSGRQGDFQPLHEVHTFQGCQMVRQVRRLQHICRGLQRPCIQYAALQLTWDRCLKDRSFPHGFAAWCQWQPEIGPIPCDLPDLDLITTIYQMAKHCTEDKLYQDRKLWLAKTAYRRYMDHQQGDKTAFAVLRQYHAPVTEIHEQVTQQGILVRHDAHAEVFIENGDSFDATLPIQVNQQVCHPKEFTKYAITLPSPPTLPDGDVTVSQTQCAYTPDAIADKLNAFWKPYWQVHTPQDTDEALLQHVLDLVPQDLFANIDTRNPQLWKDAVRQLKPHSARGVDGVSAAELKSMPFETIQDLCHVMHQYPQGFPSWLMLAKTFAVPKQQGQIGPQHVRPITVLAQVFRLWTQVLSKCILREMSQHFPAELTGFLPGRSPMDACYTQQRVHERAHKTGHHASGCCMDLIKCFNTIRRRIPLAILATLGVPLEALQTWALSMEHLQRTWVLGSAISEPMSVNNGLCEGDSFSVVGMLSLGYAWVLTLRAQDSLSGISAFADNWSWYCHNPKSHSLVARLTHQITALAGLQIDWNKSWIWVTDRSHLARLTQAVQAVAGPKPVKQLLHEMDLGCVMLYRGTHRLGKYAKRLQEGEGRFHSLQQMPHSLDVKVKLVHMGIYAQALYGSELMPLGLQHTNRMRAQLANSLFGKSRSRNSALAISVTPRLLDPELFVILKAIRSARRHLSRATAAEVADFCYTASRHTRQWQDCHGPAGCLAHYLDRLQLSLTQEGDLLIDGFVKLSLLHTGLPTLKKWLVRVWQQQLIPRFTDRRELKHSLPIAIPETQQVLARFTHKERKALLNEISGAFQTGSQQAAWDPECSGDCHHCGLPDTRHHRLFTCPVIASIRAKYQTVLQWYQDEGSAIHELPVVHEYPHDDWLRTAVHMMEPPDVDPMLYRQLQTRDHQGDSLVFYTDGSCQFQHMPGSRFAGFAVMVDLSPDDASRLQALDHFQATGHKPPSLQLVTATLLQGEPGIHRAELAAVVYVCERFQHTVVHTDSQVTLTLAEQCVLGTPLCAFSQRDDYDLVQRLWLAVRTGHRVFLKVAAHQDLQTDFGLSTFHRLGNQCVNDAAIHVTTHMLPSLQADFHKRQTSQEQEQSHLFQLLSFHLEAHRARSIADAKHFQRPQQVTPARAVDRQQLAQYAVAQPWPSTAARRERFFASAVGPTHTKATLAWMLQVRWPLPEADPLPHQELGITWMEMCLSYILFTNTWIPVKRAAQDHADTLFQPATLQDMQSQHVHLSEVSEIFCSMIKNAENLSDACPWPQISRKPISSLYVLGAKVFSQGFVTRPEIPCQAQVQHLLESYLQCHPGPAFEQFPALDLTMDPLQVTQIQQELTGTWHERCAVAYLEFKRMRKFKKQMQGQGLLQFR